MKFFSRMFLLLFLISVDAALSQIQKPNERIRKGLSTSLREKRCARLLKTCQSLSKHEPEVPAVDEASVTLDIKNESIESGESANKILNQVPQEISHEAKSVEDTKMTDNASNPDRDGMKDIDPGDDVQLLSNHDPVKKK